MKLEHVRVEILALPLEIRSSPKKLFEAILGLYERERIEATSSDEDGDMLLFQWGSYNWGEGLSFEVDLTRQAILQSEQGNVDDPEIFQLRCTFLYEPSPFRHVEPGECWCNSPGELAAFASFVFESEALNLASTFPYRALKIEIGSAE